MKLYIGGTNTRKSLFQTNLADLRFVLESYYYMQPWQAEQIGNVEHFMLDSGAFTMLNNKRNVDIDSYVDGYINFIKEYDVKHFFELDIDAIVGYEEVKRLRQKVERGTKKRCIPVWHKSRGHKEFKNLCKKYDYVAIGGIVTKEFEKNEHFLLNAYCDLAHSYDCKIHGLGFTPSNIKDYRFDSVDSTTWLSGAKYGCFYNFVDGRIKPGKATEHMNHLEYDKHNLKQYLLLQDYLCRR